MWKKNFRTKKLQTTLMFVIIMLCAMILCSAASILISMNEPFNDLAKECESASAIVYPYSYDNDSIIEMADEFKTLDVVKDVQSYKKHYITEGLVVNGKKMEVFIDISEYNAKVFSKVRYIEGNDEITSNQH